MDRKNTATVFISYSRNDRGYLERLQDHLKPLVRAGSISLWTDRSLKPGDRWKEVIGQALETAQIAILLVSVSFLASDFVSEVEVPRLLATASERGTRILPVILTPCSFLQSELGHFQASNDPTKPLSGLTQHEQDLVWERVVQAVLECLKLPPPVHVLTQVRTSSRTLPGSVGTLQVPRETLRLRSQRVDVPEAYPPIWNVPNPFNHYFTARQRVLEQLHRGFHQNRARWPSALQAITGLGGMGKTQLATQYAHLYRASYPDGVFWVRADSQAALVADIMRLAGPDILHLQEGLQQDPGRTIAAVHQWFSKNTRWLLIFDNADDLSSIRPFLPTAHSGHILLTTRALAVGERMVGRPLEKLSLEEGARFLIYRAKLAWLDTPWRLVDDTHRAKARIIAQLLDGLPLALNQAGAYIEGTQCGLDGFLDVYGSSKAEILDDPAEGQVSVARTWALSKMRVREANPAAAELLQLCALLYPDDIPEELFRKGSSELGQILAPVASQDLTLNKAVAELLNYSLLQRNSEMRTLTIHRLLQETVRNELTDQAQRLVAERAVRAVHLAFPRAEEGTWGECQRYLPQLETCAGLIERWQFHFPEASEVLHRACDYFKALGQQDQAKKFEHHAREIDERLRLDCVGLALSTLG